MLPHCASVAGKVAGIPVRGQPPKASLASGYSTGYRCAWITEEVEAHQPLDISVELRPLGNVGGPDADELPLTDSRRRSSSASHPDVRTGDPARNVTEAQSGLRRALAMMFVSSDAMALTSLNFPNPAPRNSWGVVSSTIFDSNLCLRATCNPHGAAPIPAASPYPRTLGVSPARFLPAGGGVHLQIHLGDGP